MLKTAGIISQRIDEILKKHFSYKKAYEFVDSLLLDIDTTYTPTPCIALISAFGKNGRQNVDAYQNFKHTRFLAGKHGEEKMILKILYTKLQHCYSTVSFDPLSNDVDGIAIGDVFFTTVEKANYKALDVSGIVDGVSEEELSYFEKRRDSLLGDAQEHFAAASLSHFELEKIYSGAMLFDKNEGLITQIIKDIF